MCRPEVGTTAVAGMTKHCAVNRCMPIRGKRQLCGACCCACAQSHEAGTLLLQDQLVAWDERQRCIRLHFYIIVETMRVPDEPFGQVRP